MNSLALKDIIVLDFSRLLPGPFATSILADLGARVIKIEDIKKGDDLSHFPPYLKDGSSLFYKSLHHKKEILQIDYQSPEGKKILRRLIKKANIVIESYRPQVFSKILFSNGELNKINKKCILLSLTGYGQSGKKSQKAGHDLNYMSLAALQNKKELSKIQWADLVGGSLWAVINLLAALKNQSKQKELLHIDVSMSDSMVFMNYFSLLSEQVFPGSDLKILEGVLARYQIYETKDKKWISLAALESKFWNRFCDMINKKEWKDDNSIHKDKSPKIHKELQKIFKSKSEKQWIELLKKEDVCFSPILENKDCLSDENFLNKKHYFTIKNDKKTLRVPQAPFVWNKKRMNACKNKSILKDCSFSSQEIKELRKNKIIF